MDKELLVSSVAITTNSRNLKTTRDKICMGLPDRDFRQDLTCWQVMIACSWQEGGMDSSRCCEFPESQQLGARESDMCRARKKLRMTTHIGCC